MRSHSEMFPRRPLFGRVLHRYRRGLRRARASLRAYFAWRSLAPEIRQDTREKQALKALVWALCRPANIRRTACLCLLFLLCAAALALMGAMPGAWVFLGLAAAAVLFLCGQALLLGFVRRRKH